MKIKVQKRIDSEHIILQFENYYSDFWLPYYEIIVLRSKYNHAVVDGELTMRTMQSSYLIVWQCEKLLVKEYMNVDKFFAAITKITPGIWVTMDTISFKKHRNEIEPVKSWVEIGKWILQSDKEAIQNIKNARELGVAHLLKPLLSRYVGKAFIYRDWGSKFSFSFNGKHELLDPKKRTGLIGAIICHGIDEQPFSVELCPKEGIYYSTHT